MNQFNMNTRRANPLNLIIGLVIFIAIIWLAFKFVSFLFHIFLVAGPVLLVITYFFFNKSVILNYFKWLKRSWQMDKTKGLVYTVASVLLYPFVCLFLFAKALFYNKVEKMTSGYQQQVTEEYADYVEVESVMEEKVIETKTERPYDDLFK